MHSHTFMALACFFFNTLFSPFSHSNFLFASAASSVNSATCRKIYILKKIITKNVCDLLLYVCIVRDRVE